MSLSLCSDDHGPTMRSYELSPEEYERELTTIYHASRDADGGEYGMLRTPNALKRREEQRILDDKTKHMYDNIEEWRLKPTVEELMARWRQQGQEYLQKRQSAEEAREMRARQFTPPSSPGLGVDQQQQQQQEQRRLRDSNNVATPPSSISTHSPSTTNPSSLQSEVSAIPDTQKATDAVPAPGLPSPPDSAYSRSIMTRSRSRLNTRVDFQALDARLRPITIQSRNKKMKEPRTAALKKKSCRAQKPSRGVVKRDRPPFSSSLIPAIAAPARKRKRR